MVVTKLLIRVESKNVFKFGLKNPKNFVFVLKAKCQNCGKVSPKYLYVDPKKKMKIEDSRERVNCIFKCTKCKRENHISVIGDSYQDYICYYSDQHYNSDFKKFVSFECQGCEIIEWKIPRKNGVFYCESISEASEQRGPYRGYRVGYRGQRFDIEFDEEEEGGKSGDRGFSFYDYDDQIEEEVCISGIEYKFKVMNKNKFKR